jgi:hypothetical protein
MKAPPLQDNVAQESISVGVDGELSYIDECIISQKNISSANK